MERNDLYARWANRLRERYAGAIETERARLEAEEAAPTIVQPAVDPVELQSQRKTVDSLRAEIHDVAQRLREAIERTLKRARRDVDSAAVAVARQECPHLLNGHFSLAQLEGALAEAAQPGCELAQRRLRLTEIAVEASELTAGSSASNAAIAALTAEQSELVGEIEKLKSQLRTRHGVAPNVLTGLEVVRADRTFHKLLTQMLEDARFEAECGLERDVLKSFR